MAEKASDDAKKAARNEKRAVRLMQDDDSQTKPVAPKAAADDAVIKGPGLKTRDLIDSVALATGARKSEVKKIVEATLAVMGQALATGGDLMVPPLGKLRVVKNNGIALTLKLRPADGTKAAGLALADEKEDS